ncbi:MAG: acyl-CoA synthetase [Pseudomonadales bacterium]|nr:acyl-CoA synthetase [Pseudomonadales bacterium]
MYPGRHAASNPSKIAYQMAASGISVSYSELEQHSNQGAHLFRQLGLKPSDGIAILLPNHVEYLKITWAAQRSGLYYTPISTLFLRDEIHYILENSDVKILVTQSNLLSKLDTDKLIHLKVFLVDDEGPLNDPDSWQQQRANFPTTPIDDESEGAEMIYSSGTTGQPKGVRFSLTQAPLGTVSSLFTTRVALHNMTAGCRYLSTAPLYHSAPLRYNMMVTRLGGTSTIMEKFDPEQAMRLIEANRITHSQWVPTMFVRLLKLPSDIRQQYDLSSLTHLIHAAAPCPVDIKQAMIDWLGPVLYEYYSGTEANGSTAITSLQWLSHKGSVGRAIHGELHILDENGTELAIGETGQVFFANGSDFSYYKDPAKTAEAKNTLGWSTLGDIGYLDEQGYLYLKDRKSFMIISGGVNIYPQEVENILILHEAVADVAVFGVPNSEFGEEVKAVVELTRPEEASNDLSVSLIEWCRTQLSHVKCPRSLDFTTRLPRHPTGKLYKKKLRDSYWPADSPAR